MRKKKCFGPLEVCFFNCSNCENFVEQTGENIWWIRNKAWLKLLRGAILEKNACFKTDVWVVMT